MKNENENKNDLNITQEVSSQSIPLESQPVLPHASSPTFLKILKKKKVIFVGVLLFIAVFALGSFGFLFFKNLKTVSQKSDSYTDSTLLTPLPNYTPPAAKAEASVQYIKREKILETVKIPSSTAAGTDTTEDFNVYIYDFYKIGTITSGKYQGGELILALVVFNGPCKSTSCGKPLRLRYIMKDSTVTFLPKISTPISFVAASDSLLKSNPFQKFGLTLVTDNVLTISTLEYPKEISGSSPRQVLKAPEYQMEEDGIFASSKLYKVFTHPAYGDIYTTKAEFSPSRSFEPEGGGLGARSGLEGCRGADCFTTNAFFAFRPDGTFLKFAYSPDFSTKDITWTDNKESGDEYVFNTVAGCSRAALDHNSIVAPSLVNDADLITIGKTKSTGDTIFGLKDQNHKLYSEFYNTYKESYAGPYIYPEEKRQTKSFSEFINSRPIFLWRDPFGRLIRFNNEEFLPPFSCEPIIYLYPQTTQRVSITFDQIVNLSDSTPEYRNGWNVIADPTGKILNLSDNRTYPYLFWEGWSLIFPVQSKGFVVRQSEVASFLKKTLPKLGLNEKEKDDFMKAWLPYFSDSPYYFITFLDQSVTDKIAPLKISPKPDTIIRVLMDIKPLEHPVSVIEPEFGRVPQRSGLTVVEWGGLKR